MIKIQGKVIYDGNRSQTIGSHSSPIKNVPVCLYDKNNLKGLIVLTDTIGSFTFTNVPAGNYSVIECWNQSSTLVGTGDFTLATNISSPTPTDPPLSAITNPNPLANAIDSDSPNTLDLTVNTTDILNLVFFDAPINNRPLNIIGTCQDPNIVSSADKGTWGSLPKGSIYETISSTNPYPTTLQGLAYRPLYPPTFEQVTVTNMVNTYNEWWYITDHTTGDETGRLLVVNGGNPGAIFFKDNLTVEENTYYCLSMWITNMNNPNVLPPLSQPRMGIKVFGANNEIIYQEHLKDLPAADPVTWTELGGIFNSGANTSLRIELSTENPDPSGNDYAVDDLAIKKFIPDNVLEVKKKTNKCIVYKNDLVTFTVDITNNSKSNIEKVTFIDPLDSNLSFVNGSFAVNGKKVGYENQKPDQLLNLGTLNSGQKVTITFDVIVKTIPSNKKIKNTATSSYVFFKSQNGDEFSLNVLSNEITMKAFINNYQQEVADVVESIALEQTGISHILNAESEKLEKFLSLPNTTNDDLLKINKSIREMTDGLTLLGTVLHGKLETISCQICNDECNNED